MAVDFTDYGALATLEWVLGQTPATPPTQLWVQLHVGDPGADALGNPAVNDVRVGINWQQAANILSDGRAQAVSTANIAWESVPADETYTHISMWDAVSSGNPWYKGAMASPVPVSTGGAFVFPAGQTLDHA